MPKSTVEVSLWFRLSLSLSLCLCVPLSLSLALCLPLMQPYETFRIHSVLTVRALVLELQQIKSTKIDPVR